MGYISIRREGFSSRCMFFRFSEAWRLSRDAGKHSVLQSTMTPTCVDQFSRRVVIFQCRQELVFIVRFTI